MALHRKRPLRSVGTKRGFGGRWRRLTTAVFKAEDLVSTPFSSCARCRVEVSWRRGGAAGSAADSPSGALWP